MSEAKPSTRGRGSSRARGTNRGKSLRARGRRGVGRGAVFSERLILSDETPIELDDEDAEEMQRKYSRRELGSNLDRYKEEEVVDEGVDLENRLADDTAYRSASLLVKLKVSETDLDPRGEFGQEQEEEVDLTLSDLPSSSRAKDKNTMKGKVQSITYDSELDYMIREKDRNDATRDLKERFRAKSERLMKPATVSLGKKKAPLHELKEAPALPTEEHKHKKDGMEDMEEFLDELLS